VAITVPPSVRVPPHPSSPALGENKGKKEDRGSLPRSSLVEG
jgi:hypothetical protein